MNKKGKRKRKENAINNSYQILEDFKSVETKKTLYKIPGKTKKPFRKQLPGKVKLFTEEEIYLYRIKKYWKE